jgi:oxygen-independent coproporphyrinogen-3 oxidase
MTSNTSVYLHIPFCKHRCAYCDFNTYAGQEDSIPEYVNALMNEIEFVSALQQDPLNIHTLFFGGGTPSLLSASQFGSVMDALRAGFALTADAEVSIEANPGTVSPEKLFSIREAGINRISFGVQSANPEELRMLERIHDFFTVIEAVCTSRKAGFDNLNLDLIYGLPEQKLSTWQTTLQRVVELNPEHISAYALTLEHGTPFGRWASQGLLPTPDPDLAAEMYEFAEEFLANSGYLHYEISNWAKPNRECKHNLQYWRSQPYLAFGAGAHGYAAGYRYSNALRIKTYIDRLTNIKTEDSNRVFPLSPATVNQHKQTNKDDMSEYMLTHFRLVRDGIDGSDFRARFGIGLLEVYRKEIEDLISSGLVEKKAAENSEAFRLTKRGRLLGNQVFMRFL